MKPRTGRRYTRHWTTQLDADRGSTTHVKYGHHRHFTDTTKDLVVENYCKYIVRRRIVCLYRRSLLDRFCQLIYTFVRVCVQYNIRFGRAAIYGIAFESISVFLGFNWFPAAQTSPRGRRKYTNYIYVLDSKRLACRHNRSNPYIYIYIVYIRRKIAWDQNVPDMRGLCRAENGRTLLWLLKTVGRVQYYWCCSPPAHIEHLRTYYIYIYIISCVGEFYSIKFGIYSSISFNVRVYVLFFYN